MKYLVLFLLFLTGCATTRPRTVEDCLTEVKRRINFDESQAYSFDRKTRVDTSEETMGILVMCETAHNDPDGAMIAIDEFKYSN